MDIHRKASSSIKLGADFFPVICITGPRQTGKTTLAKKIFPNHNYVSLEDPDWRLAATTDPRTFLLTNTNQFGLILDEFQHVPPLLSYLQTIVDKEQKPGRYILTGSQNFLVNEAISQSLAGRVSLHTLLPLSIAELTQSDLLPPEIEEFMHKGSYPATYSKGIPQDLLYKNYLQTYIERDVRLLAQVGDLTLFQHFLILCAARVGQLINFSSLGNECGISDNTAKRWIAILQASYIVFTMQPYHVNFGKRLVKTPKLYFYDSGLLCYLLGLNQELLATHTIRGNIFESLVISEIAKHFYHKGTTPRLYFWRDQQGHEIDCLIEHANQLTPVEIKASRTINTRMYEGLEFWQGLSGNEKSRAILIYGAARSTTRPNPDTYSWQDISRFMEELS